MMIRVPLLSNGIPVPGMFNMRPETIDEVRARVIAERKALSPCQYFGEKTGSVPCPPCSKEKGKPTQQLTYGCAVYGECTPHTPATGIACCQGCRYNPLTVLTPAADIDADISCIRLPQPTAFNPALTVWQGRLLLAYRDRFTAGSNLWLCELDRGTLQPRTEPVKLRLDGPKCAGGREDPRFFVHRGRLHISFAGVQHIGGKTLVHVLFARLTDELTIERVWEPKYAQRNPVEKNWTQFEWQGQLMSVYHPGKNHQILHHVGEYAHPFASSPIRWPGRGEVRGGATPILIGDEFYHFTHSHEQQPGIIEYTMGLYTFAARPPFEVRRVVPLPLLAPEHDQGPTLHKRVIFPGGAVLDGGQFLVSYGYMDRECRIAAFDAGEIERLLVKA